MKQRVALVLMGAWIAGSIAMSIVATQNFFTIDRLLAESPNAAFKDAVQRLGQPPARDLLRYLSSELNRLYFEYWNFAQGLVGAIVLLLVVESPRRVRFGVMAMLGIVLVMGVMMVQIVWLGRTLDFVPREPPPPGMQRFWMLHTAYTSLEMIKLLVGIVVTFWIARDSSGTAKVDRQGGRAPL
jgi:hypothetical protein